MEISVVSSQAARSFLLLLLFTFQRFLHICQIRGKSSHPVRTTSVFSFQNLALDSGKLFVQIQKTFSHILCFFPGKAELLVYRMAFSAYMPPSKMLNARDWHSLCPPFSKIPVSGSLQRCRPPYVPLPSRF